MEHHARILGPGPAEIVGPLGNVLARGGADSAFVDDEVSRVGTCGATLSGDGAFGVGQDADITAVKPSVAGLAEDKVNSAFDVALSVDLVAGLGEDGVCMASQELLMDGSGGDIPWKPVNWQP